MTFTFPADIARVKAATAVGWLQDEFGERTEALENWCVDENLFVWGKIVKKRDILTSLSVSAIVSTEMPIALLPITPATETGVVRYHRLDYEPQQPGPLFLEPLPHLHSSPEGSPRQALALSADSNLLVEFLDFLYRNYFPETWNKWLFGVALDGFQPLDVASLANQFATGGASNPTLQTPLANAVRALARSKDRMMTNRLSSQWTHYHCGI